MKWHDKSANLGDSQVTTRQTMALKSLKNKITTRDLQLIHGLIFDLHTKS